MAWLLIDNSNTRTKLALGDASGRAAAHAGLEDFGCGPSSGTVPGSSVFTVPAMGTTRGPGGEWRPARP